MKSFLNIIMDITIIHKELWLNIFNGQIQIRRNYTIMLLISTFELTGFETQF